MNAQKDPLAEVVAAVLEIEPSEVRDGLTPADLQVWDSFTHVMLITRVEEAFRITFDPTEATSIKSVGDIRTFLRKHGKEV
jgi:acyl carrier protein